MGRSGKSRKGSREAPRTPKSRRRRGTAVDEKPAGTRSRNLLLAGLAVLIVMLLVSASYLFSVQQEIGSEIRAIEFSDASGDRGVDSDGPLETLKITLRAIDGTDGFDLKKLKLKWSGPSKTQELTLDPGNPGTPSINHFATGAVEPAAAGWDPGAGKFKVKDDTIAWILVDLSSTTGIGDPLGPRDVVEITFKAGDGSSKEKVFTCQESFGTGRYMPVDITE